jgi:hypothetical protein
MFFDNQTIKRFWRTLKWNEMYLKDNEIMANAKEQIRSSKFVTPFVRMLRLLGEHRTTSSPHVVRET